MPHTVPAYPAPELDVSQWFNAEAAPTLASLRGRVVLLHAFQMLCPACVRLATPQAQQVHEQFGRRGVAVLGLHTVFEHHEAMQPVSLEAYIFENRLSFPIGVDRPDGQGGLPMTMRAYGMQGTPTLVLVDRQGRLRQHAFGHVQDLALGVAIGTLLAEPAED
ncbi:MAG TPA: TlpA disulfide reductase family protein [Ottowia sp.]|uniref:peroxiredoxin family protein n=1 Tax=Ottowia sp. TaxID=1898956 RepID=UPI002C031A91|nr:TlpA disulfide reductase family protein [Ottowia sp.]HMN21152.1 TlpA disulfide reductase family protein [Ottowia sp.]